MTLISCVFPGRGPPFMFGDLLLSTAKEHGRSVGLPFADGPIEFSHAGSALAGVAQKCVVLSDNLAVAWAGKRIFARPLIRGLTPKIAFAPSRGSIDEYLKTFFGDTRADDLSLIFFFRENGKIARLGYGIEKRTYDTADIIYAGSGGYYFFDIVEFPSICNILSGPSENGAILYARMLSKIITTSLQEMLDRSNLDFFFGGGFEVVTSFEEKFSKESYGITIWSWEKNAIHLRGPVIFFEYIDHHLLITKIILHGKSQTKPSFYLVEDFVRRKALPTTQEIWSAPFSNRLHYHIVVNNEQMPHFYVVIEFESERFHIVKDVKSEELRFRISNDFIHLLHSQVASHIAK